MRNVNYISALILSCFNHVLLFYVDNTLIYIINHPPESWKTKSFQQHQGSYQLVGDVTESKSSIAQE